AATKWSAPRFSSSPTARPTSPVTRWSWMAAGRRGEQFSLVSVGPARLAALAAQLEGPLHFDATMRALYATDASEYQEFPVAVALPKSETDLLALLAFANHHGIGLVPRAAGTSLAGQVVGHGIIVDVGRHLNRIVGLDAPRRRVRVRPGVVRNDL